MRKNLPKIPKTLLKELAEDIKDLMSNNQGRMVALEIIDELPLEIRALVLQGLSAFYADEMMQFFYLVKDEYGQEVQIICDKALDKFKMAGINADKLNYHNGNFYKAYASLSRASGRITVDIAWQNEDNSLYVECFYLTFNADGVHSFFLIPSMPNNQYDLDRKLTCNMAEITLAQAAFLVKDAYSWNQRKMTRPALGKFLYDKYLTDEMEISRTAQQSLINLISGKLTPRQTINSFFYAIKQKDYTYIDAICNEMPLSQLEEKCGALLKTGVLILEGQAQEIFANRANGEVTSNALVVLDNDSYYLNYRFFMINKDNTWLIQDVLLEGQEMVAKESPLNPFNINMYCRVYEIADLDEFFEGLERIDTIREVEELHYGLHMRITSDFDDISEGICPLDRILADLIINGDEFVVMCRDYENLIELHHILLSTDNAVLISRGEYEVSLVNAYNYLAGNYISFEDVLIIDANNYAGEKYLRFMSTIYLVKERAKILEKLNSLPNSTRVVDEEYSIFYQFEQQSPEPVLLAEYVLGLDWLTISTFGEKDMSLVRQRFEPGLYDYLELDGVEVREDGFFDILTVEMKKDYPDLEELLKELYLNKWYNSHLNMLGGLSPSEANETEEGKRLLWSLIKKIHQKELSDLRKGKRNVIKLNEYLSLIEERRNEKL